MQRILIIDDDEQVRALLFEILDRAGYEVVEAVNGIDGLKQYRAQPSALVITDLVMPEMEGMEMIMEFRREFPEARIIAISGGGRNSPGDYLRMAARLGARQTIAKPFTRQQILDAVSQTLAA